MTRSPQQALAKVIDGACRHLYSLVPKAYDRSFSPVYEQRKTKLGLVTDLLVVFKFRHRGPLPPDVAKLKLHHEIVTQLRKNKGN